LYTRVGRYLRILRKAERFVKSNIFEIQIPDELTNDVRYSPRFIDEISDELDVIEDKKAPLFSKQWNDVHKNNNNNNLPLSFLAKHRIKKMFLPMLLILKLFKLKLLLFLPFFLGLTGLKKILGLAAFVLPGKTLSSFEIQERKIKL